MNNSKSDLMGVLFFTLGGALLLLGIYYIVENASKSWINKELFTMFFVLPIGLAAFFLLGFGLLLVVRSQKSDKL
jgi:hypothetical protein